jgi:hypothetical protein
MIKTKHLCEKCDKPRGRRNKRFCSRDCFYKSRKMYRRCFVCDKQMHVILYEVENGRSMFCSKECVGKNKTEKKTLTLRCQLCNKRLRVQLAQFNKGRGKYCSKKCFNKSKYTGKNMPCDTCGKIHYRIKARIQKNNYCSYKCFRLA